MTKHLPVTMMSVFEMIDRLVIEVIKRHFAIEKSKDELAEDLTRKIALLKLAMECDVVAILRGNKAQMRTTARVHDHKQVQTLGALPAADTLDTIFACVEHLAEAHVTYFTSQTEMQNIKASLNSKQVTPEQERNLLKGFAALQLRLDACNQARADYIVRGDILYQAMLDETAAPSSPDEAPGCE